MQYQYPKSFYEDQYDLHTIKDCDRMYWNLKNGMEKHRPEFVPEKNHEDFDHEVDKCCSYTVNVMKMQRFRDRASTIKKWMDRDEAVQRRYDEAMPPVGINCKKCGGQTHVSMKDFLGFSEPDGKVIFFFECTKCIAKAVYYEDGSEWICEKEKCPECKSVLNSKSSRRGSTILDHLTCSSCSYQRTDIHDYEKDSREFKAKQEKDQAILAKYRDIYCYNEKDGAEAVSSIERMISFVEEMKLKDKKEADPAYQKAKQLKNLTVNELQKLLTPALEAENYINFALGAPEMGRYVAIGFTATDSKDGRSEYDSRQQLKKLIEKKLAGTNWRLMSDGVSYRVGIVSGRFRDYESDDDLTKLMKGHNYD